MAFQVVSGDVQHPNIVSYFYELVWNLPSLSISNTLIASWGVRFLNSLAGSVCRLCRRGLTGVFRKNGLRKGELLTCCVMMAQWYERFWVFFRLVSPLSASSQNKSFVMLQEKLVGSSPTKLSVLSVCPAALTLVLLASGKMLTCVTPPCSPPSPPPPPLSSHTVKWSPQSRIAACARASKVSQSAALKWRKTCFQDVLQFKYIYLFWDR